MSAGAGGPIVVAGGTGFLGRRIVRALMDRGHVVAVMTRDPAKVPRIPDLDGAEAIGADVTDAASLAGTLDGATAVVGAVQFPNYPMQLARKGLTFDRYDRGGTDNLVAEAVRAGVDRYVYISGAGADPGSDKSWYAAKGRAEETVRRAGIHYCILRPSWAYGPGDNALNRYVTIARFSPVVPRLGLGTQRIQPVFVDDIAEAVARMFAVSEAWGRTLSIGGPDVLTMSEVIRTMLEVLGRKRLIVPIPALLARIGTAPLVLLPRPPFTPGAVDFAIQDGLADSAELSGLLGVRPVSLRGGLARYLGGHG